MQSVVENLKLGFRIALRNWPLLLISIAESIVTVLLILAALFVAAAPLMISVFRGNLPELEQDPAKIAEWILQNPFVILGALLAILVAVTLAMVVHAFVEAGRIAVYEQSRRMGGAAAFTPELWIDEGRRAWLPLFLIYNVVWGVFSLVFLVPAATVLVIAILGQGPAAVAVGCVGFLLTFFLALIAGFGCFFWSQLASIDAVVSRKRTLAALRDGGRLVRTLLGPLLAIAFVVFILSVSVSSFFGIFSFIIDLVSRGGEFGAMLLPVRLLISLVQSAVSVIFSCWFVATIISLVGGGRREIHELNRSVPLR